MAGSGKNSVIGSLVAAATGGNDQTLWSAELAEFLGEQEENTLRYVIAEIAEFTPLQMKALDTAIGYYRQEPMEPYGEDGTIPVDEFFIRSAVLMIPMLVEERLPVLDYPSVLDWNGNYVDHDEEIVTEDVSATLTGMVENMLPVKRSLDLCRGFYLNGTYGGTQLSDDDLLWLHDNAFDVIAHIKDMFRSDRFDRKFAEEFLSVKTKPLREGLL